MTYSDLLDNIHVPDISSSLRDFTTAHESAEREDLFAEHKRKAWDKTVEARCDFQRKIRITRRSTIFFITLWQKSVFGRTLTDIKSDDEMVEKFSDEIAPLIKDVLGEHLASGQWCMITTPPRRHTARNFATRTALHLASSLGIPFYEGVCSCRTRKRMNAVFDVRLVPPEPNVICFDDIVTTGQTLLAMKRAFEPYNKNILFFAGINNKL